MTATTRASRSSKVPPSSIEEYPELKTGKKGNKNEETVTKETYNAMMDALTLENTRIQEEKRQIQAKLTLAEHDVKRLSTPGSSSSVAQSDAVLQLTSAQAELSEIKSAREVQEAVIVRLTEELSKANNAATRKSLEASVGGEHDDVLPTENPAGVHGTTRITMEPIYQQALALSANVKAFGELTDALLKDVLPVWNESPTFTYAYGDARGIDLVTKLGFKKEKTEDDEKRIVVEGMLFDRFKKASAQYDQMLESFNASLTALYALRAKKAEILSPITPEMKKTFVAQMIYPGDIVDRKRSLHELSFTNCMTVLKQLHEDAVKIDTNLKDIRSKINHPWNRCAPALYEDPKNKAERVATFEKKLKVDLAATF